MIKKFRKFFTLSVKISTPFLIAALLLGLLSPYINPYYFWIAAFMGLAYPVTWILCFVWTILLIGNRKWFLLLLIFVIAGTPMMLRHFLLPLKNAENSAAEYRIASYNVHGFAGLGAGRSSYERQKLIHDFVNGLSPDVVCMQEYPMKSRKHARYIDHLNYGLHLSYKHLSEFDPDFKGTSYTFMTASKYPVIQQGTIFTMESDICGIFSDIQFPEGIIRVYNIHLQSVKLLNEKKLLRPQRNLGAIKFLTTYLKRTFTKLRTAFPARAYQATMIAESIKTCPYPVIIAGDFNDTPASYSYRQLSEGFHDAAINRGSGFNKTYVESLYPIRIDHVMIDDRLNPAAYKRFKIYLSDHFPVEAGFSFKQSR